MLPKQTDKQTSNQLNGIANYQMINVLFLLSLSPARSLSLFHLFLLAEMFFVIPHVDRQWKPLQLHQQQDKNINRKRQHVLHCHQSCYLRAIRVENTHNNCHYDGIISLTLSLYPSLYLSSTLKVNQTRQLIFSPRS